MFLYRTLTYAIQRRNFTFPTLCQNNLLLSPVFCMRVHVLFTLLVFALRIVVSNTYCFVVLFCLSCVLILAQVIFTKQSSETDIITMLEFLIDNLFAMFGGREYQNSQHTYEYKLFSSSRRLVPLFVRVRQHTGVSHEKRKKANPIL